MSEVPSRLNGDVSFPDIHDAFANSPYGDTLDSTIRYDRYRPEHIDQHEWTKTLGADVNGLRHMPITYGVTRVFLRDQREARADSSITLNEDEERILLLAAQIHDWQEAVVGDINFELRTAEDEEEEHTVFSEMFDEFFDANDPQYKNVKFAVETTIFDRESKLGRAFNAVERAGYIRTGLRAYEKSKEVEDQELSEHLEWLSAGVLSNQITTLLEYEQEYPFIARYLDECADVIDEVYESLDEGVFIRHGQTESIRHDAYGHSRKAWQNRGLGKSAGVMKREAYDRGVFGTGPNLEKRLILDYEELERQIDACRTLGMKIVLTSGSFDVKHVGHERYLYMAHQRGDILVVGVDSDRKIQQRKGINRPINPETERLESLVHLRYVDFVTLKEHEDPKWHLIKTVRPDTLIVTQETYDREDILKLEEYCGEITVLPPQATTSTSAQIGRFLKELSHTINEEIEEAMEAWIKSGKVDADSAQQMGAEIVRIVEGMIKDA